ncbi:MAG: DUF3267 domain-containing protein [Anaerolineae bacterium]|nr:DUF3267 domain-containing protein [Anaerolineae bacterium]
MNPSVSDKTLSPKFVNLVGTVITFGIMLGLLGLYTLIWRKNPLELYAGERALPALLISLIVFLISLVIHEGLHGIGYRMGGVAWSHIKFGIQWKALMPYAHCKAPMRAQAYGVAVALPGFILGVIPSLIGLTGGSDVITLFGAAMLAGAVGDMMILALLTTVRGNPLVQDHPTKPGFQVLMAQ